MRSTDVCLKMLQKKMISTALCCQNSPQQAKLNANTEIVHIGNAI